MTGLILYSSMQRASALDKYGRNEEGSFSTKHIYGNMTALRFVGCLTQSQTIVTCCLSLIIVQLPNRNLSLEDKLTSYWRAPRVLSYTLWAVAVDRTRTGTTTSNTSFLSAECCTQCPGGLAGLSSGCRQHIRYDGLADATWGDVYDDAKGPQASSAAVRYSTTY